MLPKIFCSINLVFYFKFAQLQVGFLFKFFTTKTGTGIVNTYNNKTFFSQHLVPDN